MTTYNCFLANFLAPEFEENDVARSSGNGQQSILGAHGQLFDGQVLFARLGANQNGRGQLTVWPQGFGTWFFKDFARLQSIKDLKRQRRRVPEFDRSVHMSGDDHLCVARGQRSPLATIDGPFPFAETAVALGADRVQRRNQVTRAVGDVETARDGRLVDIHRIGILETGEAGTQQVYND